MLPAIRALRDADEASVVAAIADGARIEAAAAARRLAAIGEFVRRRAEGPADSAHWSCHNWDAMAAEVAAAQGVTIHVVAEASALDADPDPHMAGQEEAPAPIAESDVPCGRKRRAVITGGGVIPPAIVAELIRGGTKVRPVRHPADAERELGYRPSAELERFI